MDELPKTKAPAGTSNKSSGLLVAVRVTLLMLVAGGVVMAFVVTRGRGTPVGSGVGYVCPMHPSVTASAPGECPICGMALQVARSGPPDGMPAGNPMPTLVHVTGSMSGDEHVRPRELIDLVRKRVFSREVRAPAWVDGEGTISAYIYKDDLVGLEPSQRGSFATTSAAGANVDVRLTSSAPLPRDEATVQIRCQWEGDAAAARPGEVGWITFAARPHEVLVISYDSVLESESGPYVLAAAPDGHTFTRQPVEIGKVLFGMAVVVSGVHEGQRIAARDVFYLDAERRLRQASEEATP